MLCGVMILIPALLRAGPCPSSKSGRCSGSAFRCLLSLLVLSFGLVPAIIVQSAPRRHLGLQTVLEEFAATGGGLSVGATLIFKVDLGVILPAFALLW